MTFKHIIITRFSAYLWGEKLDNNDQYLQYRLALFRRFCLPSILTQSSCNFTWLVLFGRDTPKWFRTHINEWERNNVMIPIYVSDWADAIHTVKNWIYANIRPVDFIITSRLDNDDSLAINFVYKIQECIPDAAQCFKKWKTQSCSLKYYYIEPIQGQQVDARSNDPKMWKFYAYNYRANPFMSMIEPFNNKILTVYWKMHPDLVESQESFVKQINGVMWMQVIHSGNHGNRLWSKQNTSPDLHAFPWLSKYLTTTHNRRK